MHCISSDDVTISHGKQPPQKVTVINDDCQPGKYIVSMSMTKNDFWDFDDFGGRSRCLSKIHDEIHPKPFQLAS